MLIIYSLLSAHTQMQTLKNRILTYWSICKQQSVTYCKKISKKPSNSHMPIVKITKESILTSQVNYIINLCIAIIAYFIS